MAGAGQRRWSVKVSNRATPLELAPLIDTIRAIDPAAVTVEVSGPSKDGVCRITVEGPPAVSDDVNSIFTAYQRQHPEFFKL